MKLKVLAYFVATVITLCLSPLIILIFLNAFIPHPRRTVIVLRDERTRAK